MSSQEKKETISNILNEIDEIKENLTDQKYLHIVKNINSLYKIFDNNLYEISYITIKTTFFKENVYGIIPVRKDMIIKLTTEEHNTVKELLVKKKNWVKTCGHPVLHGIYERMNLEENFSLIGQSESDFESDIDSRITEIELNMGHIIICKIEKC